jgi:hypothetical protein
MERKSLQEHTERKTGNPVEIYSVEELTGLLQKKTEDGTMVSVSVEVKENEP